MPKERKISPGPGLRLRRTDEKSGVEVEKAFARISRPMSVEVDGDAIDARVEVDKLRNRGSFSD